MGKQSLVALDTDHIKQYVFATDKLKEIRGASSILDNLNRRIMQQIADDKEFHATPVYTNGGAGLFLVDGDKEVAKKFGQRIQQAYNRETVGGASITFAVEEIPSNIQDAWNDDIWDTLELLRYKLAKKKNIPPDISTLPSHPFLYLCDACGTRYAERKDYDEARDEISRDRRYCEVCIAKRREDGKVKDGIDDIIKERKGTGEVKFSATHPFTWEKVIKFLSDDYIDSIPGGTERPPDFNELRGIAGGKNYLALIYADGNAMGQLMSEFKSLAKIRETAESIDDAVYEAMSDAISKHLKVVDTRTPPMFPFDILLIGGDDIMIVTSSSIALDVARTIAVTFFEQTRGKGPNGKDCTISISVVLAPVNYPFGLLQDLAQSTLKFAKTSAAKNPPKTAYGDTVINFMTVTGSNSLNFNKVYDSLRKKTEDEKDPDFYATLRPYSVEELTELLNMIRQGKQRGLGRTKLHQLREAVLRMNLTTSVSEALAVLNNWRGNQRELVVRQVYELAERYQQQYRDVEKPGTLFQRVTFPWFADGPDTYRSSLYDFCELYDFVAQEEVEDAK
ncbi:MAG: Cas10/Cmr2 second palm domain-containing protein [Ktedonobacteraceae bacterium]